MRGGGLEVGERWFYLLYQSCSSCSVRQMFFDMLERRGGIVQ